MNIGLIGPGEIGSVIVRKLKSVGCAPAPNECYALDRAMMLDLQRKAVPVVNYLRT